eukprot:99526-Prymnesium_polylepis.2
MLACRPPGLTTVHQTAGAAPIASSERRDDARRRPPCGTPAARMLLPPRQCKSDAEAITCPAVGRVEDAAGLPGRGAGAAFGGEDSCARST